MARVKQLRNCLIGFYIGDSFASPYDLKPPRALDKITIKDKKREWTENGDVAASILQNRTQNIVKSIIDCYNNGIPGINHKAGRGFSTAAKKILDNPDWPANPREIAESLKEKGSLALFNLPITTSIGIIGAPVESVQTYASLFVADKIAGDVAVLFHKAIAASFERIDDCESVIAASISDETMARTAIEFSRMKLADLQLNKQPLHPLTTMKVICYALRVVEYAHKHEATPDLMAVMRFICTAGGDTSSNCAIACAIICSAVYKDGLIDVVPFLDNVANVDWIINIIDNLH